MLKTTERKQQRLFGCIPIWQTTIERTRAIVRMGNAQGTDKDNQGCNCETDSDNVGFSGTKGDVYTKELLQRIIDEGCLDKYPSSTYSDGAPAHTYSINHVMTTYDLTKGEFPLITLRPIAIKSAIGELLWIYQDQSNDLNILRDKYGVTWWDEWDIGNRTIGAAYGEVIRRHDFVNALIKGIKENPDGRRHIINMWQDSDFKDKHGLKPCAYQTAWNVRHGKDGIDYLDMCLYQRSSDFMAAGCINQMQYLVFLHLIARHLGYTPGRFSWFVQNIQIYDRHLELAKELITRNPVECSPRIWLNPEKQDFFDFTVDDIKIKDYPRKEIAAKNPQMKLEIGHQHVDVEGFELDKFITKTA